MPGAVDTRQTLNCIVRFSIVNSNCQTFSCLFSRRLFKIKMLNDPQLVFDFAYDEFMSKKFSCYTAKHVLRAFASNRKNRIPFDMRICNGNMNTESMQHLQRIYPNLLELSSPLTVRQESYLDLYPKERILYITPYSPNVMNVYDPNDTLVVPAIVDYGNHGSVTMSNAKKNGIRTAWLPVEKYLQVNSKRYLPVNIISDILLDFKNTRSWEKALVHLPQRHIVQPRQSRHFLSRVIDEISNTKGEMPEYSSIKSVAEPPRKRQHLNNSSFNANNAQKDKSEAKANKSVNIKNLKLNPFD